MNITNSTGMVAAVVVGIGIGGVSAWADGFTDASSWETFDAKSDPNILARGGYVGAVFDGRYVYFVPHGDGLDATHAEVLRYDTSGDFQESASWDKYDPGSLGGYVGAVFDEQRYVYFVPLGGNTRHGEVLRYDMQCDSPEAFKDAACWATYTAPVGAFAEGVFDGQYIYFAPHLIDPPNTPVVLRYDTTCDFSTASCWKTFDVGANLSPPAKGGYQDAAFDGQFVYFGPVNHAEVLRYNTECDSPEPFTDAACWATYEYGEALGGYRGVLFNPQDEYVYFVAHGNYHGQFLRYNTNASFAQASSWDEYDPGENGVGIDPDGYYGSVLDPSHGYIYFAPSHNGSEHHGEVLRYDTDGPFDASSAWETYDYGEDPQGCDAQTNPPCTDPDGYEGAVFDGRYVYFVPHYNGSELSGEVLRYDTLAPDPIPTVSEWGMVALSLLVLGAGTVVLRRRRVAQM